MIRSNKHSLCFTVCDKRPQTGKVRVEQLDVEMCTKKSILEFNDSVQILIETGTKTYSRQLQQSKEVIL